MNANGVKNFFTKFLCSEAAIYAAVVVIGCIAIKNKEFILAGLTR